MKEEFIFNPEKYGFVIFGHTNIADELWVSKKQARKELIQGFITLKLYVNLKKWGILIDGERVYFGKIESENIVKRFLSNK